MCSTAIRLRKEGDRSVVFSSPIFLFAFLPALLLVYFFARKELRNWILVAASLFFYAFGEPRTVFLMLLSILVNYAAGLLIEKYSQRKKMILTLAVLYNLAVLFVFKYLNFTVNTFNTIFGTNVAVAKIALPIGISFYTFQIMSYVIDVYRGKCEAQKSLLSLALYVSLFPQLIAGPIVRYVDIEKQIRERESTTSSLYEGFLRFGLGFAKKVLIADQLAPLVEKVFAGGYTSVPLHWIGAIAYALQIYYDFSGYSDMAIGLGKIFGFRFAENFDYPYISQSIREFWRRWHISLSTWFRDYLYIPLGGNRKGNGRTYLNLLIVFLATGLWHGASFNFLVWGLYHGLFLILERVGFGKILDRFPRWVRHLYTILIVVIGWVFFRADNLTAAVAYIGRMFVPGGNDLVQMNYVMDPQYWFCLCAGILFSIPVFRKLLRPDHPKAAGRTMYPVCVILLFVLAVCFMVGSGYSPFLYFRF